MMCKMEVRHWQVIRKSKIVAKEKTVRKEGGAGKGGMGRYKRERTEH